MMIYSSEQQYIVDSIVQGYNVIVEAVAGSGKTTVSFAVSNAIAHQSVLVLTYNKDLRLEMKVKMKQEKIHNAEVHTFHSFFRKYVDNRCDTDKEIYQYFQRPFSSTLPSLPHFDLIIGDELQDCTYLYYQVLVLIALSQKTVPQWMFCGDRRQGIYKYMGSDSRFLSLAPRIFSSEFLRSILNQKHLLATLQGLDREWRVCTLKTSYRCPKHICDFINMCSHSEDMIPSRTVEGRKVTYLQANTSNLEDLTKICQLIMMKVREYGVENVILLSYSVAKSRPVKDIANLLRKMYPSMFLYIPSSDSDTVFDKKVIVNKLVFSTYHSSKGLGRKVDIILDFHRRLDDTSPYLPNEVYVALSRGSEELILLENRDDWKETYNFIDRQYVYSNTCHNLAEQYVLEEPKKAPEKKAGQEYQRAVSDLTKTFSAPNFDGLLKNLTADVVVEAKEKVVIIPSTIVSVCDTVKYTESVSEITGTALPALYELITTGKIKLKSKLMDLESKNNRLNGEKGKKRLSEDEDFNVPMKMEELVVQKVDDYEKMLSYTLKIAVTYSAEMSGFRFKAEQISHYDWISQPSFLQAMNNIHAVLGNLRDVEYEVPFHTIKYSGCIDACSFTDDTIVELKTVQKLKDEHYIQLTLYGYLYWQKTGRIPLMILLNILTGETIQWKLESTALQHFIDQFESVRAYIQKEKTESEFLLSCQKSVELFNDLFAKENDSSPLGAPEPSV
jgi:superfamily I DNA/RNA helicase